MIEQENNRYFVLNTQMRKEGKREFYIGLRHIAFGLVNSDAFVCKAFCKIL